MKKLFVTMRESANPQRDAFARSLAVFALVAVFKQRNWEACSDALDCTRRSAVA